VAVTLRMARVSVSRPRRVDDSYCARAPHPARAARGRGRVTGRRSLTLGP
jgi:hypothetical protein